MLWTILESSIAILLATIAPTIALVSINIDFFSNRQIRNSLLLVVGIGTVAAGLFGLGQAYLYPLLAETLGPDNSLVELSACMIALSILFLLSERTISELIADRKHRLITIVSIYVVFAVATYLASISVLNVVLAFYIATSSYDYYKNRKAAKATAEKSVTENDESDGHKVDFKHTPNVYVLFLESLHSTDALRTLYDIDNSELSANLVDNGFTIYEDVFSNHPNTVHSFTSLVCPDYLYNPDVLTKTSQQPKSEVFSVFKDNGYSLNLISEDFLKVRFSYLFDHLDSESSAIGINVHRKFAPILSQSALLRRLFSAGDFFECVTHFDKLYGELRAKIVGGGSDPQLNWVHFGACHSPYHSWDKLEGFEDKYRHAYGIAKDQLARMVAMIKELDPDGLIIAVGDHGAHRYRYVGVDEGKNPNEVIRARGFDPQLIAKDHFSVFLGIHWPVPHYTEGESLSHIRIFRHVIAALAEDKTCLESMMPNLSLLTVPEYGQVITVRDGVPLNQWEPASKENQLEFLTRQAAKNPRDVSLHLCLLDHYFDAGLRKEGAEYALSLCRKFPDSEIVHTEAAKRMMMLKDLPRVEELAQNALRINPRSGAAFFNLALAAELQGDTTKHDLFIEKTHKYDDSYIFDRNAYLRYGAALLRAGDHDGLNTFYQKLDGLGRVHFDFFVTWQMLYRAYITTGDKQVFGWLDDNIVNGMSTDIKLAMLAKKIVVCTKDAAWSEVVQSAKAILDLKKSHLGAYIVLGHGLEQMGMADDALQAFISGVQATNAGILLEQLGAFANRHKIYHPALAPVKITSRELLTERSKHFNAAVAFDEQWYVNAYGPLIGQMSPIEHYMTYSFALMLNPNGEFDTGYYLANNPDVFAGAVDASLHYTQLGKLDQYRPQLTCLYAAEVKINTDWRTV